MRLLLVEDHQKLATFVAKGLREEGYAVDHVIRGDEVLSMVQLESYDLIILDLMLPGADGFSIIADLRRYDIGTPILILTARDDVADRVRGLDLGADDYLVKPFAFDELTARIRALLRRSTSMQTPVLEMDDLHVDPSTREVTRAGNKIELTAKEYALLEFLLRNKGRAVSRTSIIEHVWDMHFDSDTNLVEVYICYLRKKIDSDAETKLIHTVRGGGYMMRAI